MTRPSFDPAAWLDGFAAIGGSYALTPEGKLWLGEIGVGADLRRFTVQLAYRPERVEAIKAAVRERCMIA
jgi:hypothetical protein